MSAKRKVTIEKVGDCWMIYYVDRVKGQRRSPGQFTADMFTRADVVRWIKNNPKITL